MHRKQALFYQAAIFGSRGQLLADIATLLPIDAVEFVKAGFEQDRFIEHQVAAAVGDAEGETVAVPGGEIDLREFRPEAGDLPAAPEGPGAEPGEPPIHQRKTRVR